MDFKTAKKLVEHGVITDVNIIRDVFSGGDWRVVFVIEDQLAPPQPLNNTKGDVKVFKTLTALVKDLERITAREVNCLSLDLRG
jgi:hypothetical protein